MAHRFLRAMAGYAVILGSVAGGAGALAERGRAEGQEGPVPTLPQLEVRPPSQRKPVPDSPSGGSQTPSLDASPLPPNGSGASPSPSSTDSNASPMPSSGANAAADGSSSPRPNATGGNRSPFASSTVFPSLRSQSLGGGMSDAVGLNNLLRSDASLFEIPQLANAVDRQRLEQRQASSMFRALQNEVGVTLQQTGNGQLSPFLRGLTGQQILVLIDGIRVNNSVLRAGPNQYAATIDPGSIDHIEILRGAQSAMWGSDAIGGAINIVTRSANPLYGDHLSPIFTQYYSTAEASTYTRTGFGGWYGKTGVFGGVSYMDVGRLDRGGGLGRQPATDYEQFAGDLKIQRLLNDDHMLTVVLQHFEQQDLKRSDRFLPFVLGPAPNGSVPIQRPTIFDPQQRNLIYVRQEGLLDEAFVLSDAYSITLTGSRTKEGSITDRYSSNAPAAVPNRREIGEFDNLGWGTIIASSKEMGIFGKLTCGADFYDESIDATRTQTNNPTNPASVPFAVDPQYPDDSRADRVGSFASWNVLLTERLDMTASVRYENLNVSGTPNFANVGPVHFERTYQDWIGSVGLVYEATEQLHLVGGVYEGFRAPTIDDLTANKTAIQNAEAVPILGNLAIQPERSITYEVGIKVDRERWRMQLIEFWTDFDSYIGRQLIGNNEFLSNQEASINGTELAGEYLYRRDLSFYGNFSYAYGDVLPSRDFFPRIPPAQGILGMRVVSPIRHTYFDVFTWMVRRADRYNAANLSDVRFIPQGTPGFATLNVRTGKSFGKQLRHRVSLSLENLTDRYYRVLGSGVDGAGFNANFGYEYQY